MPGSALLAAALASRSSPEIAANDEVRLLVREYDQVTDMVHKGYRRQVELYRKMHEIVAQFP
jgi:hypothetical protein